MIDPQWRQLFAARILERGETYAEHGTVRCLEITQDSLTATVMGTQPYDVHIRLEQGAPVHMTCTCPYAAEGHYCKHMAAVLLKAEAAAQSRAASDKAASDTPPKEAGFQACPQCGRKLRTNENGDLPKFCPYCGEKIEKTAPEAAQPEPSAPVKEEPAAPAAPPVYDGPVVTPALMYLPDCERRDLKYGIILWLYLIIFAALLFWLMVANVSGLTRLACFVAGLLGFLAMRTAARTGLVSRTFTFFWIFTVLFMTPLSIGAYQMGTWYWGLDGAYRSAIAAAKDGRWVDGENALGGYKDHSKRYTALYDFCQSRYYVETGIGKPCDFDVKWLPDELQALGEETKQTQEIIKRYQDADYIFSSRIKRETVRRQENGWKALFAALDTYKDEDLPAWLQPEATANRKKWLEGYEDYQVKLAESKRAAASEKERKKAEQAKIRARQAAEERTPGYWRKRKAEEDYSRGYDDGRFAYSEGFHDMPSDDDESDEYMNGFADAQQEAEEEEADEKARAAAEQAEQQKKQKPKPKRNWRSSW